MNGKKVLNHLIKLFLVINIVLFFANLAFKSNQYLLSEERLDNIKRLLNQNNINVETELIREFSPKYTANLTYVGDSVAVREKVVSNFFKNRLNSVKRSTSTTNNSNNKSILYYTLENETLAFNDDELIYTSGMSLTEGSKGNIEQAENMCITLLSRIDPDKQKEKYSISYEDCDTYWKLIYYPLVENIPVLDSYMEFKVNTNGVIEGHMYLAKIEVQDYTKQDIYAVDMVLFGLMDYMQEEHYSNIEEISMCYKYIEHEENILGQQIIPMYKIKISGLEEPIFVNAYTNKLLEIK